jgi:hypothetical protein
MYCIRQTKSRIKVFSEYMYFYAMMSKNIKLKYPGCDRVHIRKIYNLTLGFIFVIIFTYQGDNRIVYNPAMLLILEQYQSAL